MIRLCADLEPVFHLYGMTGGDIHKPLLRHAIALESAGVDGLAFGDGLAFDSSRRKILSLLSGILNVGLSVRASVEPESIDALLDIKPSMAIFRYSQSDEARYFDIVTRLQVANILVGFEMPSDIETVKKVAMLKGDFLIFDCRPYIEASGMGEQIEQLNRISKAAALGSRLSMGSIAAGDFDRLRLAKLAETKSIEEIMIGLPVVTDALLRGYENSVAALRKLA